MPAPGGGAASALQAAQGAALLGMVARYTTGEKYAQHQVTIGRIIAEVDELREIALRLAEADADAFHVAVADAYRLPQGTEQERAGPGRRHKPGAGQRGLAARPGDQCRQHGGGPGRGAGRDRQPERAQ